MVEKIITFQVLEGRDVPKACSLRLALIQDSSSPSCAELPVAREATSTTWIPSTPLNATKFHWSDDLHLPLMSVELWDSTASSFDKFISRAQRPCEEVESAWWEFPRRQTMQPALHISISIQEAPPSTPLPVLDFEFRVPTDRINWRRLNEVNIGAIVHTKLYDVLEDSLDMIMFGDTTDDENDLNPAMVLLQLTCQYANHCRVTLSRRTTELTTRLEDIHKTKASLEKRRMNRTARRDGLARELNILKDRLASLKQVARHDTDAVDDHIQLE
ncbi:hypothetical protein Ae201684_013487 [Aphanomyces euteiches]|uniref:Cilium assembly protein DZIP1 N-terminal domain-containing protein n=1 Tax=Aphanomyces euteiches TaxID=100861 RepID=A0A6G0WN37_9STRA|nr:hypothetical protein Ae201684_013487 [Aphanomyces euteiches]KAH9152303.1 hypothetical protein AeRB84_005235 [Aphanomyces euteiches]